MIIIKLYELSLCPRLWFNLSIKLFISKPINKMLMTVFLAEYNLPQWIIVRACSRILERSSKGFVMCLLHTESPPSWCCYLDVVSV